MLDVKLNGIAVENVNRGNLKKFILKTFVEEVKEVGVDFKNTTLLRVDNQVLELVDKDNVLDDIVSNLDDVLSYTIDKYSDNIETTKTVRIDFYIPNTIYCNNEEVDAKHIILDVSCKKELGYCSYETLCKCNVTSYDKDNYLDTFYKDIIKNNFNAKQESYAMEWFEEKSLYDPIGLNMSNFIDVLASDITLNGLEDYLNLSYMSLSEIVTTDFSVDIKNYILDGVDVLNVFEDKLKVEKDEDSYIVYLMDTDVESVEFKIGLIYRSDY